jgi:hypothetical protein
MIKRALNISFCELFFDSRARLTTEANHCSLKNRSFDPTQRRLWFFDPGNCT